jgi:hypothetical protein
MGYPTAEFASGHSHDAHDAHTRSPIRHAAANADHTDDHEHADIHDVSVIEWITWTPF